MQFMRSIAQESKVSPRESSTNSRKRRRTDGIDGEASTMTSAAPMDDAQDIPDLWEMPFVVSKDTWAVTKCLEIHGRGNTLAKWTPAHFVAIAMWYGGIKAGIQAAKAIRIFGIWSPRVGDKHDELPSMEVKTGPKQILSKIWPTSEYEQKPLLDRANRHSLEKPFTNFDEAHNYLLHLCIGPDLSDFPTVTLAPILHNHFDHKVDLESASEAVVGYAIDGDTLKSYTGTLNLEPVKRNQAGGRSTSRRGRNREKDILQTDDNEDDEENFEAGPNRPAAVKSEFGHSDTNSADNVRLRLFVQSQERSDASCSHVNDGQKEHNIDATRCAPARSTASAHSTGETQARDRQLSIYDRNDEVENRISGPSPSGTPVNDAAVTATELNSSARREPLKLNKQVMNMLYEQTCDVPSHRILSFSNSCNPPPTLPSYYWKGIWNYREVRKEWASGSKDQLPWPDEPETRIYPQNQFWKSQKELDDQVARDAKNDLVKFERFCRTFIID